MGGKVEQVNDNVVLLSNLTGAEYFDAFVDVKDISAVVVRVAADSALTHIANQSFAPGLSCCQGFRIAKPSAIVILTHMITKNIGMLLLAIYLIAVGILTLTGLGIGIITGVLALLAGIFILIGR